MGPKTEKHKKRCAEKERNTLRTKAQTHFWKKRRLRNTTGRSILGRAQGRLFPTVAPWKMSARKIKKSQERAVQHSNSLEALPVDGGRRLSFCPSSLLTESVRRLKESVDGLSRPMIYRTTVGAADLKGLRPVPPAP